MTRPPKWPTSDDFGLVWRDDVPAISAAPTGQPLTAVELLEWVTAGDLANGSVAVGLQFTDDWLTVYNALEENGLTFG